MATGAPAWEAALQQLVTQGTRVQKAFAGARSLADLHGAYKTIPIRWALALHCLCISTFADGFRDKFLIHFWACYLAGFGGGVASSIILMNPVKAPIALFTNNDVGVFYAVGWWLMNYFPFGIVRQFYNYSPLRVLGKLSTTFMRVNLMISRVDIACELFPGVIAAPLILGTIAGSGGKFITDIIRFGWGALDSPAEASQPSFVWRSGLLGSAVYYFASHVLNLLSREEAAALVITVLLAHTVLSEVLGPALSDFTYPVFRVAHAVSLVPMPGVGAAAAGKGAAKKSGAGPAKKPAPAPASSASTASKGAQGKQPAQQQAQSKDTSGKGGKGGESKKSK